MFLICSVLNRRGYLGACLDLPCARARPEGLQYGWMATAHGLLAALRQLPLFSPRKSAPWDCASGQSLFVLVAIALVVTMVVGFGL